MKAQSSTELLILVGAMLVIFITLLFAFEQNISLKTNEQRLFQFEELGLFVKNEIEIAANARDGYQRNFQIPEKVVGKEYNITLVEEQVYIQTLDGKISLAVPAQNVTGQILKGQNIIRKVSGEILLNQ